MTCQDKRSTYGTQKKSMSTPMSQVGKMRLIIALFLYIRISSADLPTIAMLQKTPSSPITCHATGFYPDGARLFWTTDGEEINEGVEVGEIINNHDGTFQMNADLDVSSIPYKDWGKYNCVFQFTESKEIVSVKLEKKEVQTEYTYPTARFPIGPVIGAIVGFLIITLVCVGVCKYKQSLTNRHRNTCCNPSMI